MSSALPDKRRVRAAFDRAAAHYDEAAELQREAAQRLCALLPQGLAPRRVLEAGAGTGYCAPLLAARYPGATLLLLDFAPAMLAQARRRAPAHALACADVEALPLAARSLDLYWSNLTLQWCALARALRETHEALAPGGWAVFSSLGPATLQELRAAFAGLDDYDHALRFAPADSVADTLAAAGFADITVGHALLVRHAPHTAAVLRGLKALGAHQVAARRPTLLGRGAWRALEARYESLRQTAGLPVSWELLLCRARRPR